MDLGDFGLSTEKVAARLAELAINEEEQALVVRWQQIWGVAGKAQKTDHGLYFKAELAPGVILGLVRKRNGQTSATLLQPAEPHVNLRGLARLAYLGEEVEMTGLEVKSFALLWLTTFRRCSWLSGCPLELTSSEKAEWMCQGRELGMKEEDFPV